MSDSDNKNIRRFGRGQRKDRLPRAHDPIPDENELPVPDFDIDNLPLPDRNAEALDVLSNLDPDAVKAPVITPTEDRFPALHIPADEPTQAESDVEQPKSRNLRYNIITVLSLLGTLIVGTWIVLVWVDPQTPLNPLAPPTPFVVMTATPMGYDPNDVQIIVATETPTPASDSTMPFIAEAAAYQPNTNPLGCNWWSIAGQVRDSSNQPLNNFRIRIQGADFDEAAFSSVSSVFGAGGYEMPLSGLPQEAEFTVQLFSPQGSQLSDPVAITTSTDCDRNVVIVNFVQIR